MTVRRNVPMAVLGLACTAVALAVLAGARDWGWTAGSWIGPVILVGLGIVVLVSALTRNR